MTESRLHQINLTAMCFLMTKTALIIVFWETGTSYFTVFTLAIATLRTDYGFEFTNKRWRENIRFHCIQGLVDYVLASMQNPCKSASPISFENTSARYSMGFNYKVSLYCADPHNKSLENNPSITEAEATNFAADKQTIGATTRHYWTQASQQIINYGVAKSFGNQPSQN
jgi:hypothetical protein